MYNIYTKLQSELNNTITYNESTVPAYYEDFVDTEITMPCISWKATSDMTHLHGDTLCYSDHSIQVSIWSTNGLEELHAIASLADRKLNDIGFRRSGSQDLSLENGLMKKVMLYRALSMEEII